MTKSQTEQREARFLEAMEQDEAPEHAEHVDPAEEQPQADPLWLNLRDYMLPMLDH